MFKFNIFMALIFFCGANARQTNGPVKIKYISANHIYLDAGTNHGIAAGDTIQIIKERSTISTLKVVFTAANSSSCEVISKLKEISVGDIALITPKIVTKDSTTVIQDQPRKRKFISAQKNKQSKTRISGYVSTQWYHYRDAANGGYNFDQPTFRINYKARNLWEDSYNIRIKARSRYYENSRRFNSEVPQTQWRNRIYEFSFSYDNPTSMINYKFGRLISNKFSGVGYIDGLQLQHNISDNINWGIFAGTQPQWQYSDLQTSFQKYGAFVNYTYGDYSTNRFESTMALVGTYHGMTISREALYLQNVYNQGRKWNIYQSLELDLNRYWRKEKTGESISLSGLYINGRYYLTDNLNMGISYDNRKNYFTYEMRTLPDSLFDDAFREGVRFSISYQFLKNYRVYGNTGVRKRDADDLTYSYSSGLNINNILKQRITTSLRLTGFSNVYTKGMNPSLYISKYFLSGHNIQIGYGSYGYTLKANDQSRLNQFFKISGQLELPYNFFITSDYEYSFGDDSEGHRIIAELGYRF